MTLPPLMHLLQDLVDKHEAEIAKKESSFSDERERTRLQFKRQVDDLLAAQETRIEAIQRSEALQRQDAIEKSKADSLEQLDMEKQSHRLEVERLNAYHQKQQELMQKERENYERTAEMSKEDHRRRVEELEAMLNSKRVEIERNKVTLQTLKTEVHEANDRTKEAEKLMAQKLDQCKDEFKRKAEVIESEYEQVRLRQDQAHALTRKRYANPPHPKITLHSL